MSTAGRDVSVAALVVEARPVDAPTSDDLRGLRDDLRRDFAEIVAEWGERPAGSLRVAKWRLRAVRQCPAQVLGELTPSPMSTPLALGVFCDLAAGLAVVNPARRDDANWFDDLLPVVEHEHPDAAAYVTALDPDDRAAFAADVGQRCAPLPELLGDLRGLRPTVRERVAVRFDDERVVLNGEVDIAAGIDHRVLVEIKSGSWGQWIEEELRYYAFLVALRDLRMPVLGCPVSLADEAATAFPFGWGDLEGVARQVVSTVETLVEIDQSVARGTPVRTSPGAQCGWCPRSAECADADELALADRIDPIADDGWADLDDE